VHAPSILLVTGKQSRHVVPTVFLRLLPHTRFGNHVFMYIAAVQYLSNFGNTTPDLLREKIVFVTPEAAQASAILEWSQGPKRADQVPHISVTASASASVSASVSLLSIAESADQYGRKIDWPRQRVDATNNSLSVQDVVLSGYFQSDEYLRGIRSVVRAATGCASTCEPGECVVHVCRGDYLQLSDKYIVLGVEYYLKALREGIKCWFGKQTSANTLRVAFCSDDMAWVASTLLPACQQACASERWEPTSMHHVEWTCPTGGLLADWRRMQVCELLVCSNSSFSVSAGLLGGTSIGGMVYAPQEWYCPSFRASCSIQTLYPAAWTRI
jgi:hypothetical protein